MRAALTQFDPSPDPAENARRLTQVAERAAADGAGLLLAPEGSLVSFLTDPSAAVRMAEPAGGPFGAALVEASERFGLTIAAGSFVPDPESGRVHNTLLVAAGGELIATYRKIHLYDAFSYLESDTIAPGSEPPPIIEVQGVKVGLATCYDLRFPELFRVLQQQGAEVLAIASAWVRGPVKEEHWMTLLRARAIENTCYVVAADQIGKAGIGRSTAFDPFGLQLLDLGTADPGYGVVEVQRSRVAEVRRTLPVVQHARFRIDPRPSKAIGRPAELTGAGTGSA